MSGPKGIGYEVVSAAELARRELAAALARVHERHASATRVLAEVGEGAAQTAGRSPEPPTASMTLTTLRELEASYAAYETSLRKARAAERESMARAALQAQVAKLRLEITVEFGGPQTRPIPTAASHTAEGESGSETDAVAVRRRLAKVLDAATGLGDPTLVTELTSMAQQLRDPTVSAAGARHLLTELEARVTRAARERQLADAVRRRADELAVQYADIAQPGFGAQEATQLLSGLRQACDQSAIDTLAARLRELRQRRVADSDRQFALTQATEVLEEMGYSVTLARDGADDPIIATATSQRWPSYGLRVVFRSDKPSLHTSPFAIKDTDPMEDTAFETDSCADIARFRADLGERGLSTDLQHRVGPGELPVRRQTVPPRTARPQTATRQIRKERRP